MCDICCQTAISQKRIVKQQFAELFRKSSNGILGSSGVSAAQTLRWSAGGVDSAVG
ncbi:hypothetical protein BDI4_660006 [Burkholderia diffusa]|nr:hypothetical protein BDI4_660006 [Burkholderia diffusa]